MSAKTRNRVENHEAELAPALLAQLCAGRSNKEIAVCFGLREGTVKSFARSICQKLGARNRRHLVMLAEQGALV